MPNPHPWPPQKIWIKDQADALEPLTPHEARHCAASYMIAAGMDWKKITEFIGHNDVRTTYNRYGKVVPEDLAPAAAQLEEYFDRGRARLQSRPQAGEQDWWWQCDGSQGADPSPQRVNESGIDSARRGQP